MAGRTRMKKEIQSETLPENAFLIIITAYALTEEL